MEGYVEDGMEYALEHYNKSKFKEAFDKVQEKVHGCIAFMPILDAMRICMKISFSCKYVIAHTELWVIEGTDALRFESNLSVCWLKQPRAVLDLFWVIYLL